MNNKVGGRIFITSILAIIFIITACGTLEVGVEPADSMGDPVNTATQTTQAALVTGEADSAVTAVATLKATQEPTPEATAAPTEPSAVEENLDEPSPIAAAPGAQLRLPPGK